MSEIFQQVSLNWWEYFSFATIQNSIFLLMIFILLNVLKNSSAQTKYIIGLIGLTKLLIPPFLPVYLVNDLFSADMYKATRIAIFDTDIGNPVGQSGYHELSAPMKIEWSELIFILWIVGMAISLFISLSRVISLTTILLKAKRIDWSSYSGFRDSDNFELYLSSHITMPVTVVLFPRRIFVPHSWYDWDEQCRRFIIRHELTHIQNRDNLTKILQVLVQSLYFFHPFVYFINRKIDLYREMACDDKVVRNGRGYHLEYSKCLMGIAEKAVWKRAVWQSGSTFINKGSDLAHRILYQMKEETMSNFLKKLQPLILSFIILSIPMFSWYTSHVHAEITTFENVPENTIEILVSGENDIRFEGNKISLEKFSETLATTVKEINDPVIELEFDSNVNMPLVFKIQRILREQNLLKVTYGDSENNVLNLKLPGTTTKEQLKKIAAEDILTLIITSSGKIKTENLTLDISELEKLLRESHKENEYLVVTIKTENDVLYEDFIIVLDSVRKSVSKRVLIHESVD
jgi:beta-lactamase regulating signal transducer with metallopeptidase domain